MLRTTFARASRVMLLKQLSARYMSTTMRLLGAQAFAMPAMSPTMEKGGIVEWKFKVGQPFSAGDVILEVETDKAQIDVEAQDDGKLAKIVVDDGAKDIPVGETIAYIAETEDDLSALQLPETPAKKKANDANQASHISKPDPKSGKNMKKNAEKSVSSGVLKDANPNQTLLPSVSILLAENGISKEDALNKIKGSGKDGRMLKGDVLAFLGKISADSVVKIAEYIKAGERLDLSNVELRTEAENKKPAQEPIKVTKPEPVILSEQLILRCPANVKSEELQKSVRAFLDEAYRYTHGQPLANTQSDYFDPLFEDLVTPAPTEPRFKYTYQLIPLTEDYEPKGHQDVFDLLAGTAKDENRKLAVPEGENSAKNEYALSFNVQVSDKYHDAREKSQRFVDYLKQLEFI